MDERRKEFVARPNREVLVFFTWLLFEERPPGNPDIDFHPFDPC
jgi:hypothetical protein